MPKDHVEVFRLLKLHMSNAVVGSEYNWVRPRFWTSVFGVKDKSKIKDKRKEEKSKRMIGK